MQQLTPKKWKAVSRLTTDLSDKLKIILKKLNEIRENKDKQLNKMRKTTHEQNYKVNKEIEAIEKIKKKSWSQSI